jgi:hypothetical protein
MELTKDFGYVFDDDYPMFGERDHSFVLQLPSLLKSVKS